ncbi:MAG: pyrroline-5-carboxylate reductase [Rhodothalassiaceae bacterium]|nr:MAG: pyrroline-5-carboxylate reductase [Rhodothalassiaceae bacterium]
MQGEKADETFGLLVIGAGRMGGALLEGLGRGGLDAARIAVVDPAPRRLPDGVRHFSGLESWAAAGVPAGAVLLAVKPQQAAGVLAGLEALAARAPASLADALLISIAAGVPLAALRRTGLPAIRAMPNLPARIRAGVTTLYADADTPAPPRRRAEALFARVGRVIWLARERDVDLATAVSGSGPAYVYAFAEALEAAARDLGFAPEVAAALARQTVIGAARLMEETGADPAALREEVTSPGGTTAAALAVFGRDRGLERLCAEALAAAARRADELFGGEEAS